MPLKEYEPGTAFTGVIGRTFDKSEPAWPKPLRAKEGAPNVLFIVLDDTGFGQLGAYGSPIETPNIDALAAGGLTYTNMHTTALCSPTRSCISLAALFVNVTSRMFCGPFSPAMVLLVPSILSSLTSVARYR